MFGTSLYCSVPYGHLKNQPHIGINRQHIKKYEKQTIVSFLSKTGHSHLRLTTKKRAELDWTFLQGRSQERSAKENDKPRQDGDHKMSGTGEDMIHTKESKESQWAVKVVKDAMERIYDKDIKSTRTRPRRATLSRFLVLSDSHHARGNENRSDVIARVLTTLEAKY